MITMCIIQCMAHTIVEGKRSFFNMLCRDFSGIPTHEKDGITYSTDTSKADV